MPIYVYRPAERSSCEYCEHGFETIQKFSDPPLTVCPECSSPVEKAVTVPNIATAGPSLNSKNTEKHGFTKYEKVETGVYEKTSGTGPDIISDRKK